MSMTPETEPRRAPRSGGQPGEKPGQRANSADRHVGARIRERRIMMGLSQQQLAKMIGVTYQQAHKYERGLNRISAGRLFEIAQVLGVPVSWFFEGLADRADAQEMSPRQRMCLELARNFALIDNEKHQEALSQMARALAAQSQAANAASPPPVAADGAAAHEERH
jgi:transcriptional regulator with XRE-family HTH domain